MLGLCTHHWVNNGWFPSQVTSQVHTYLSLTHLQVCVWPPEVPEGWERERFWSSDSYQPNPALYRLLYPVCVFYFLRNWPHSYILQGAGVDWNTSLVLTFSLNFYHNLVSQYAQNSLTTNTWNPPTLRSRQQCWNVAVRFMLGVTFLWPGGWNLSWWATLYERVIKCRYSPTRHWCREQWISTQLGLSLTHRTVFELRKRPHPQDLSKLWSSTRKEL